MTRTTNQNINRAGLRPFFFILPPVTMSYLDEEQEEAINRAVKKHVGDAVSGLREDFAEVLKKTKNDLKGAFDTREKGIPADGDFVRCKVTGPGYSEQFTHLKDARKAFATIKNRLRKGETPGTVKLFSERANSENGRGIKWDLVQEWKTNEDAFA